MSNREIELKTISDEFALWELRLQNLSSMNLFDAHNLSEDSICELFNNIFNYNLINLNTIDVNFPAIDLGDLKNSICIQVTSTKTSNKIQKTIDKFIENNLHTQYSELFIVILGKKQKKYHSLKINDNILFDYKSQILDFRDILNLIRSKPINQLKKISKILKQENNTKNNIPVVNHRKIKRNFNLKRKLEDFFLRDLDYKESEYSIYEPWIKFTYSKILVKSINDCQWPLSDMDSDNNISSWFKAEFWDFYENGIEFVSAGSKVVINKDGSWKPIDYFEKKTNYPESEFKNCVCFLRIPYEYIIDFDMATDPYDGLPSLYVTYAKDGMPYENILYGEIGSFKSKKKRIIFDEKLKLSN